MLNSDKQTDIKTALEFNSPNKQKKRNLLIGAVIVVIVVAGFAIKNQQAKRTQEKVVLYETVPIKRGDLTMTVTATGKLEPVTQVDIGIEVSGTVAQINVDFNDPVTAGQVLAVLDTTKLGSQVQQDQGALQQAKAKLQDAEASVMEKQKILDIMRHAQQLSGGQLPAKQDIVTAEANLKRAQALESQIKGSILQTEGQLKFDTTNLNKASIKTPIDGIVLDRKIEKGQTVAASLQTPVMFTIAKNLTEMELHVDVDEADVGKIKLGQPASFTVDAYPDKSFPAKVSQIRYAPQTVGGVVTYETVLLVNNADLLLRPGMTATADMTVNKVKDVLLVPGAALRFSPTDAEDNKPKEPSFLEKLLPRGPRGMNKPKKVREKKKNQKNKPKVWLLKNNQPQAVIVKIGLTDGEMNEVIAPELKAGMSVIVDTVSPAK
jgi:HlyD family secretion protein